MSSIKILKFSIISLVIALLLTSLLKSDNFLFPAIMARAYYFRILTGLIFSLWLCLIVLEPKYRPKTSLIIWSFLGFVISLLISAYTGVNFTASFWSNFERMEGWITIFHLFLLLLIISTVFDEKKYWHILFNGALATSLLMATSAYYQVLENGWNFRADGLLGNSTYLGAFGFLNAFLAIYLLVTNSENLVKRIFPKKSNHQGLNSESNTNKIAVKIITNYLNWIYLIIALINIWMIFQSNTRGSILALLGGLILMSLIIVFGHKNRTLKIAALIFGLIFLSFAYLIYENRDSNFVQNYAPLQRVTSINIREDTANARIIKWYIARDAIMERPVFGWGQSNFNYAFGRHYRPEHHGNETKFDRVHNLFLDWLVAGGIVGFAFYLLIWAGFLWAIYKTEKISINQKSVLVAMMGAYVIHNFFVFDQLVSYLYFIFILGFAVYLYSYEIKSFKNEFSENLKFALISIVIIFAPILIYQTNVPSMSANRELLEAMTLFSRTPDGRLAYRFENQLLGNIDMFERAINRNTFANQEIKHRMLLLINQIGMIDGLSDEHLNFYIEFARYHMQNQIERYPDEKINRLLFGSFLLNFPEHHEEAEEHLRKAIELAPRQQSYRIPLINHYARIGRHEEALELARETYELDPSHDDLWEIFFRRLIRVDVEEATGEMRRQIELGNISRVEKVLLDNLNNNPDEINHYTTLAAFYFQIGEKEKSLDVLNQISTKFPDLERQIQSVIQEIKDGGNPLGRSF